MPALRTIPVLVPGRLNPDTLASLSERFAVHHRPARDVALMPPKAREAIRGLAVAGEVPIEVMDLLPNLEIIAHFGVGYDGIDAIAAAARRITVTNTPDVLTDEVADTALGLLLMTARDLGRAEAYLRAGRWAAEGPFPLTATTLRGRRAGIMGLGRIGLAIARRLEAFGLPVSYHNRRRRGDVAYPYHETLEGLAAAVDTLIVAAPGGAETDRVVNAAVLKALGPDGILVNVGRGTSVDEAALIEALETGTIGAAGLDVFADEPRVPGRLLALPNAVLLPHVASASQDTRRRMSELVVENLVAWFEERALPTPVVESAAAGLVARRAAGRL